MARPRSPRASTNAQGHLFSKMRYISAQLVGYLEGGVWIDYAANANAQAASLGKGLEALDGFGCLYPTQINMVHVEMPLHVMEAMQDEGFGIAARRLRPVSLVRSNLQTEERPHRSELHMNRLVPARLLFDFYFAYLCSRSRGSALPSY
eukprot:SAG11_NODE_14608_length_606_cov_0.708087_2_plen_149_part_00